MSILFVQSSVFLRSCLIRRSPRISLVVNLLFITIFLLFDYPWAFWPLGDYYTRLCVLFWASELITIRYVHMAICAANKRPSVIILWHLQTLERDLLTHIPHGIFRILDKFLTGHHCTLASIPIFGRSAFIQIKWAFKMNYIRSLKGLTQIYQFDLLIRIGKIIVLKDIYFSSICSIISNLLQRAERLLS